MKKNMPLLAILFFIGCGVSKVGSNSETLDVIYPKFIIYSDNTADTVEWTKSVKLKGSMYKGVLEPKKQNDFDKVYAYQNQYGFYLKYPGRLPYTARPLIQSWPHFFERILKGKKIDLFKTVVEFDDKRTGLPENSNSTRVMLMAVSRDKYYIRQLLTPNILKEMVNDNARAVEMVDSKFKLLKERELLKEDKVIEILNYYNNH
jgi:hypothetical protein